MTPRTFPDLIDIEHELFELPHKVCVFDFTVIFGNTEVFYRVGTRHL